MSLSLGMLGEGITGNLKENNKSNIIT
jgi:hypothetical protein